MINNVLDLSEIDWIFFDVGSTLIDEQKAYEHRAVDMLANTNVTFAQFDAKRMEFAKSGLDGNSQAIKYFNLTKTPWHHEDEKLYDSVTETLAYLKGKGYKLGIIANQSEGLQERLQQFSICQFLSVIVASDDIGVYKPDAKIFQYALQIANCAPEHSIMVGDRLDNDVAPAKRLGMHTMWIRQGLSIYQDVLFGKDIADIVVDGLQDIKKLF